MQDKLHHSMHTSNQTNKNAFERSSYIAGLTSVVLVSYHTGAVLNQSLKQVLAQSQPVELIVVNNGNPPEVLLHLQKMAQQEHRLKLLNGQGNVGFATGCNLGAKQAQGEYLLILNPDCVMSPHTLEQCLTEAAKLPQPYMLGARLMGSDGHEGRGGRRDMLTPLNGLVYAVGLSRIFPSFRFNHHQDPVPAQTAPVPAISGAFMFMPWSQFAELGGFDESYFLHVEDLDLCMRFHQNGGKIYFAPKIEVMHVKGTSDVTSYFVERHKIKGFRRYFARYYAAPFDKTVTFMLLALLYSRLFFKLVKSKF